MRYIPHTEQDIKQMLAEIGVRNVDELFDSIPESLRLQNKLLELPRSLPESELTDYLKRLQKRNYLFAAWKNKLRYQQYNNVNC